VHFELRNASGKSNFSTHLRKTHKFDKLKLSASLSFMSNKNTKNVFLIPKGVCDKGPTPTYATASTIKVLARRLTKLCGALTQPWKWCIFGTGYSTVTTVAQASGAHCPGNGLWTRSYAANRHTTTQS